MARASRWVPDRKAQVPPTVAPDEAIAEIRGPGWRGMTRKKIPYPREIQALDLTL
jgi:hypothetical protein